MVVVAEEEEEEDSKATAKDNRKRSTNRTSIPLNLMHSLLHCHHVAFSPLPATTASSIPFSSAKSGDDPAPAPAAMFAPKSGGSERDR